MFAPAANAAASQPNVNLQRTAQSTDPLMTTVSQDVYRTEDYQDSYTVQVPYQEEETYYENVPYQEKETYTDYEEYWDTERVCRQETVYDDQCRTERKCTPRYERRCERRRVCSLNTTPSMFNAILMLVAGDSAFARPHEGGPGGPTPPNDDQRRQEEERRRQEQERQRQDQERRQREEQDRQNRDRQERERQDRDRQERERQERQRGEQERQRQEQERRQREEQDRQNRDRQERERQERDRAERDRRDREERDRREREERERRCNQEVCENVVVGQDCRDERVCQRVPRQETRCENQQVRKTRPVIKERWVTKYRQERRTRTVTRYRDEVRCCVTRQRQVFDHQYVANVEVRFPADAVLAAGEAENFAISLVGSDATADLQVTAVNSIYTYKPQIQKFSDKFIVTMDVVPTYQAIELGDQTLGKFQISTNGRSTTLSFVDQGLRPKLETTYHLSIVDAQSGAQLWTSDYNPQGAAQASIDLQMLLPAQKQVYLRMDVARYGLVVDQPVLFSMQKGLTVVPEKTYDPAPYMDASQVGKFSTEGSRSGLIVYMRDLTQSIPQVKTEYALRISVVENGQPRMLAEKVFARETLKLTSDGRIVLSAAREFGIAEDMMRVLTSGKTIIVEGQVIRRGILFPGEMFSIPKRVSLGIE